MTAERTAGRAGGLRRLARLSDHAVLLTRAVLERLPVSVPPPVERWDYDSPLERDRLRRVLTLACERRSPAELPLGDVLEVGCAGGHFTAHIAPLARSVLALDVLPDWCARATARCAAFPNVRVGQGDLEHTELPRAGFDTIFAMDVLEYVHGRPRLTAAATRLAAALRPGGVIAVSATRYPAHVERAWWARRLAEGGTQIVDVLSTSPSLTLVQREAHPPPNRSVPAGYCPHVIALFEKRS